VAKAQQAKKRQERCKGRQRGGQRGHKGQTRALLAVEQADEGVICKPSVCSEGGSLLSGEASHPQRDQVTELPLVRARVPEYQMHQLTCPHCQKENIDALPAEGNAGQFGPNLVSALVMQMGRYGLSKRQVVDWLENCYDVSVCPSSVVNLQNVVSEALTEPIAALREYVQAQSACNIDQTSWREASQPKKAWLWTVVTPLVSVFEIALSRSGAVARDLLEHFQGIVGSDRHSGVCQAFSVFRIAGRDQTENRPLKRIANWLRMCAQLGRGMVHFLAMSWWANQSILRTDSAVGKMVLECVTLRSCGL
jgi:transposase